MKHLTLVEDDDDDFDFFNEAFSAVELVEINRHRDGLGLLTLLRESKPTDAIVMDLKFPLQGGYETLIELKSSSDLLHIPVIILTSSIMDEERCLKAGCSSYFTKPNSIGEYKVLAQQIFNALHTA